MYLSITHIISFKSLTEGQSSLILGGQESDFDGIDFDFGSIEGKEDLIS